MRPTVSSASTSSDRAVLGEMLLHPAMLLAIVVLVLNDHALKGWAPGVVSGKLSDFAGLCFFPAFLQALWELPRALRGRLSGHSSRVTVMCCGLTAGVFAAVQLWAPAGDAYRFGLGALKWPFQAVHAILSGANPPGVLAQHLTQDVTDLVALPAAFVALWIDRMARSAR